MTTARGLRRRSAVLVAAALVATAVVSPLHAAEGVQVTPPAAAIVAKPSATPAGNRSVAATAPVSEIAAAARVAPTPVRFRGEPLLEIRTGIGSMDIADRAAAIERRLLAAAALPASTVELVRAVPRGDAWDLLAGSQFILTVTPADAAATGLTAERRAADLAVTVRAALERDHAERSAAGLARAAALSLAGIGAALAAWLALHRLFGAIARAWRHALPAGSGMSTTRLLSEQVTDLIVGALRIARLGAGLSLFVLACGYALSLFPWTRGVASALDVEIRAGAVTLGRRVLDYVPNLLYVAVTIVGFRIAIRFARLFFDRVANGQLQIRGFHPDWGPPTFQIVRVLLIAFAAAVAFPYLPGSDSRAFQGVTVLLGVVVSFGSASAVSNLIGGLVLTYMRALDVGDRVRIGETEGDVVGRDAFVVRVRTIKNVEITIPNSTVLSGPVVNFSAGARGPGLLAHTGVTIGYDVPWRRVHALLLAAARRASGVETEPAPFVLQTALDDCYVHYQLNVCTRDASRLSALTSELHANIQDEFAAAGIEILSPAFLAHRDGTASTVPPPQPAA